MKKLFKYFLLISAILPLVLAGADAQSLRLKKQVTGTGGGMVASRSSSGLTMSGAMSQVAIETKKSGYTANQGFWSWNGVGSDVEPPPDDNSNLSNFPNPFSSSTTIIYKLPGAANVTVKVYDMLGNEIVKLYDGYQQSGENRLTWNAKDIRGGDLSTGSYLCELVARPAQLAGGSSFSAFTLRSVMVLVK